MGESIFLDLVSKFFPAIAAKIGKENQGNPRYSFKERFSEVYSLDGSFEVLKGKSQTLTADVVAMDSPLPLKNRPAISVAMGKVPKIGTKRKMNETQLKKVIEMRQSGRQPIQTLVNEVFDDTKSVINAVDESLEEIFLNGLSSGVALVSDNNVGIHVRLNFGFLPENKTGVPIVWGGAGYKPITDIRKIKTMADNAGVVLSEMHLDSIDWGLLLNSDEAKAAVIGSTGLSLAVVSDNKVREYLKAEFGLDVVVVTRVFKKEIDGKVKTVKAWEPGKVTFTPSGNLGELVYTDTVESIVPTAGVVYTKPNAYTLASKYAVNNPTVGEITESQAMVMPVINMVDEIFQIDTKVVQA